MLATDIGARNAALNVTTFLIWSLFLVRKDRGEIHQLVLTLLSEIKRYFYMGSSGKALVKCSLDRSEGRVSVM